MVEVTTTVAATTTVVDMERHVVTKVMTLHAHLLRTSEDSFKSWRT
jgi:hypothetical protein